MKKKLTQGYQSNKLMSHEQISVARVAMDTCVQNSCASHYLSLVVYLCYNILFML